MNLLALIGHPIGHSLSPLMFNSAMKELGLNTRYEAVDIDATRLEAGIRDLISRGCTGFNVTVPHKQAIIPLLNSIQQQAKEVGAVNAVVVNDGLLHGYNTDVHGVLKSLESYRPQLQRQAVVLLGAGGAARAVLFCLVNDIKPSRISIVTRTVERGNNLASALGGDTPTTVLSFSDPSLQTTLEAATLIVNATPVGMNPNVNASPLPRTAAFHGGQIVFDLIYTPLETTLIKSAAAAGATTIGGLEMLIQQGARAFELFTGKRMPVELVRKKLEEQLKATSP
jgi:shikimate dehydrogenase